MELEEEYCKPTDGLYMKGDPECEMCHHIAQSVCKIMALERGRKLSEVEGLLLKEEEDD